jgi:hypothetical protein
MYVRHVGSYAFNGLSTSCFCIINFFLNVVGNEKGGKLRGCLLFEDGFGPWRSMSVCFLILLSSFTSTNFRFRVVKTS